MNRKSANKKFLENNPELRAPRMEHVRHIKPEFFVHECVAALTPFARLAWIGLWTQADKFGRFPWRPKWLKTKILPYDDVDFAALLDELLAAGFIGRYSCDGEDYGYIVHWSRHQGIATHEKSTTFSYPAPPNDVNSSGTVHEQFMNRTNPVGKGKGKGVGVGFGVRKGVRKEKGEGDGINGDEKPPIALPPSLKASQERGQKETDDVEHIQGACYALCGKTPNPEHVQKFLLRYNRREIERAFQTYFERLDLRDHPWAEKTFFADGGGIGVLGQQFRERWQKDLVEVGENPDYESVDDFLLSCPVPGGIDHVDDLIEKARAQQAKILRETTVTQESQLRMAPTVTGESQ